MALFASRSTVVTALSSLALVVACGSSADDGAQTGGGEINSSTSSGGSNGTFGGSSGSTTNDSDGDPGCAAQEAQATAIQRPVDIVFVIDNSGSMSGEISEVEKQINQNFASIIEASKIDYRVIMVTKHGLNSNQDVCISAPLAGGSCAPVPAQPMENARFFHHSQNIESHDSLCFLLKKFGEADQFNKHPKGYGELLRKDAFKTFVVITDDGVACTVNVNGGNKTFNDGDTVTGGPTAADAWDAELLKLSPEQFGTAQKRNYVFHSIIGIADFDSANKALPHQPTSPLTAGKCPNGSVAPGTGYQALSIKTGGLRYPTCDLNYTTVFQEMAKGVIEGAKVSCEYAMPAAPPGEQLDPATAVARYTSGTGATKDFGQVASADQCAPDKFYIEGDRIKLCPAACDVVQNDAKANVKLLFACKAKEAN
jgi:hypothetical protein